MSMAPFLTHAKTCDVCRTFPQAPCTLGRNLLREGAERLTREAKKNPRRARA